VEEVLNSLDFIDGSIVKNLKLLLTLYMGNPDEEGTKQLADVEIAKILEAAEIAKKIQQNNL
jgi:hypothetical protein